MPSFTQVDLHFRTVNNGELQLLRGACPTLLEVGRWDSDTRESAPPIYTWPDAPRPSRVGWFSIGADDNSINRLEQEEGLHDIAFQEPFCDLADDITPRRSKRQLYDTLKALVLYYYLEAGHIMELKPYNSFGADLTRACDWIDFEGNHSHMNLRGDINVEQAPEAMPEQDTNARQGHAFARTKAYELYGNTRSHACPKI